MHIVNYEFVMKPKELAKYHQILFDSDSGGVWK